MIRFFFIALLIGATTPVASAQSAGSVQDSTAYCDSLCRVPLTDRIVPADPPFMCDCMVIIGGGSTPGDSEDAMTPAEILDRMWADRERRVANVSNYTVVQTTSSVPLPVVLYYEKEMIDGLSAFQLISPAELADREAAANGQPTSEDMGTGIVALADALGGLLGGSPEASEDEAARSGEEPAAADASPGSSRDPSGPSLAQQAIDGLRNLGEGLQEGRGRFEEQQGIADDLFFNREFIGLLANGGKREVLIDGTYYSCDVLLGHPAIQQGLLDFDLGPGSEGYSISYVEMYISDEDTGFIEPVAMVLDLNPPGDQDTVKLTRTHRDYRQDTPDGPVVPRRTSMTMDGIAGLIQGAVNDVWTEFHTIQDVLVNDGAPTSEQSARLIADAMERLGLD